MEVFPILPDVRYDYASRFGAAHQGTDIFAPLRSAVVAVESGRAHADLDPKGGTVIYLTGESGARYYYAHLDEVVEPLDEEEPTVIDEVEAGDVIGFVGTTGNAQGKQPHLHFQVALRDEGTVDPAPLLAEVDPKRNPNAPDLTEPESSSSTEPSAGDVVTGLGSTMVAILLIWWLFKD